jgi:hypothetical protein
MAAKIIDVLIVEEGAIVPSAAEIA